MKNLPKANNHNIIQQESGNELLLYHLINNKAYCLNSTSALVFQLSDGTRTVTEISDLMSRKLKAGVSEDFVHLALNELKKEELLENAGELSDHFEGLSRREIVKRVGLATLIALPVISTVVAPSAVMASSLCVVVGINYTPGALAYCTDSVSLCDLKACEICSSGTGTLVPETGLDTTCRDSGISTACICN